MSWDCLQRTVAVMTGVAIERRDVWDGLDAVVGDGDFGTNLARGFEAVRSSWSDFDSREPSAFRWR